MKKWKGFAAIAAALVLSQFVVQLAGSSPAAAADSPASGSATTSSDKSQVKTLSLSCNADQQVTGGGAAIYGDVGSSVLLTEMRPIDSRTYRARAAAVNYLDKPWSLQVWVICANKLPGWETKYGDSGSNGSTFKTTFTYPCSEGKQVISAGGVIYGAPDGLIGLSMIRPDGPLTIGRASARAVDGYNGNWGVTSVAICAYPTGGRHNVGSLTNISNATATCPGSEVPFGIGGGGGLVDLGPVWLQEISTTGYNVRVRMTSLPKGGMVTQLTCGVFTLDPHPSRSP